MDETVTPTARPISPCPSTVTRGAFEARLEQALADVDRPEYGLFGPDSMAWRVARHTLVNLPLTVLGETVYSPAIWPPSTIVPESVRYLPAYHEAQRRVTGRPAGRLTRSFNKRLIGKPEVLG